MNKKTQILEDMFGRKDPLSDERFLNFMHELATGRDPKGLRDFFIQLNWELYRAVWDGNSSKKAFAEDLLRAMLGTNQGLTIKTLKNLIEEMELYYYDPLVELLFEASSQAPPLLSLIAEVLQMENQLLELRIRVQEALFMKGLPEGKPRHVATGTEGVLHFLNEILYKLKQGSFRRAKALPENLLGQFEGIHQFISDADSLIQMDIGILQVDSSIRGGCRILGLAEEAVEELAVRPNSIRATRVILEILRANSSLPVWHPAAAFRSARMITATKTTDRALPTQEDAKIILPLIIDKVIEVVLTIADGQWRSGMDGKIKHQAWERILLKPSDPSVLESVLLDQNGPPRIRSMAAALLRMLAHAFPSIRLSSGVEFYSDLFLTQFPPGPLDHWPEHQPGPKLIDIEEKIQFLLEAFDQKSDHVRWNASAACYQAAVDHPEWFQTKHHIRLLSLLSDNHYGVRLNIVRTFKVLAGYRDQGMAQVTQDISRRLREGVYGSEYRVGGPQGLEAAAFAIIFDSLMQQIHELQQEVQRLETRRKTLLNGIERQSTRIGEEIHHEILNTRCGYLATSIDEEAYAEANKQLQELVMDLRRIMNNLYPQDLDAEGFLATMRKRLEDAKRQMQRRVPGFTVELDCQDVTDEDILRSLKDKSHLVLLYRILLEAIINARKHSDGTCIALKIRRPHVGMIDLSVSDNGGGDGGPFQENAGIPLVRQRVEEIGAQIEYKKASPKGGTTVVIHLLDRQGL